MTEIVSSVRLPAVHPFTGMDLATALDTRAQRYPAKIFLIWEPGPDKVGRSWTYAEFADDVARTAAGLAARGVRPGDPVMVLLDNTPTSLLALFACARLGAVAINTNNRYKIDELRHAVSLTGPVAVVTHPHRNEEVKILGDSVRWVVSIDEQTGTCPALQATFPPPSREPDPAAALCVQFTSGTTSRPKAVLFTHANALWGGRVGATHAALTHHDVTLVYAPLFHTAALSWQTLATFWVAGTVVLLPKFTASRFWAISTKHACTSAFTLGVMMRLLAEQPVPEHSYRFWTSGLEMPALEQRYGVRIFSAWGMTEVVSQPIINEPALPSEPGSIGRVAPEYKVKVVGPDGQPAKAGEVGDLYVHGDRGLSVFAEYLADPQATSAAFDHDGYFNTGDRVKVLPSGAIQFVTRAKDMLKVGGENVAAAEIERILVTAPGVAQAAVVGHPDPLLDEVPVAFITLTPGADQNATISEAATLCHERLADFKVPRSIHVLQQLPTVTMDKIAKGQLKELAIRLGLEAQNPQKMTTGR
jgi:carnitine-CoA ligase